MDCSSTARTKPCCASCRRTSSRKRKSIRRWEFWAGFWPRSRSNNAPFGPSGDRAVGPCRTGGGTDHPRRAGRPRLARHPPAHHGRQRAALHGSCLARGFRVAVRKPRLDGTAKRDGARPVLQGGGSRAETYPLWNAAEAPVKREPRRGVLLEGDFYLRVAARCTGIHHRGNPVETQPYSRPLRVAENDQCNFPVRKVLRVSDILVGAKKHFVPGILGLLNQFPVFQLMPANPTRICDFVAGETTSNRSWVPLSNRIFISRRWVLSQGSHWQSARRLLL